MWFTETPWPPIFICLAGIILLAAAWYRQRRGWQLLAILGLAAACVAIFAFERWYVTEEESPLEIVEASIPKLAEAVEEDDVETVLEFIAEDNERDRAAVKNGMASFRVRETIRITDVQVRYNDDRTAILSHFRANGDVEMKHNAAMHHRFSTRWRLTWEQRGENWRIVRIERLDPVTDKTMEINERR